MAAVVVAVMVGFFGVCVDWSNGWHNWWAVPVCTVAMFLVGLLMASTGDL